MDAVKSISPVRPSLRFTTPPILWFPSRWKPRFHTQVKSTIMITVMGFGMVQMLYNISYMIQMNQTLQEQEHLGIWQRSNVWFSSLSFPSPSSYLSQSYRQWTFATKTKKCILHNPYTKDPSPSLWINSFSWVKTTSLSSIHHYQISLLSSSPAWKVSHEWKPVLPTFLTIIRPTPTKPAEREGHHREIGTWHDKWKSLMKLSGIILEWQPRSCNRESEMIFEPHNKANNIEIYPDIYEVIFKTFLFAGCGVRTGPCNGEDGEVHPDREVEE